MLPQRRSWLVGLSVAAACMVSASGGLGAPGAFGATPLAASSGPVTRTGVSVATALATPGSSVATPSTAPGVPLVRTGAKFAESEVRFVSGANTLFATLTRPAPSGSGGSGGKVPAMLLIADRSQTDRNGNGAGAGAGAGDDQRPNTLVRLADLLAADGVATLRFDKFGTGKTGAGTLAAHPENVTFDLFTAAARAALASLRKQPGIDPRRVGVLGHGEGALIALDVAANPGSASPVRGLVVLDPPGFRSLEVLEAQLLGSLNNQTPSTTIAKVALTDAIRQLEDAVKNIRAGKLDKVQPKDGVLQRLFAPANLKFLQTQDLLDPQKLASALPVALPVFTACALRTSPFPCRPSGALRKILGTGPKRVSITLPDADHVFRVGTSTASAPTSPELISGLQSFVKTAFSSAA